MSSTRNTAETTAEGSKEDGGMATPAQTAGEAGNDFTRIKLRNGIELSVPSSGVENKLLGFLKVASNKSGEFDLAGISFDAKNATLSPSASDQLQNVAKILKAYPNTRIAINAYANNSGDKASGLRLMRERADSVLRELARIGVDKSRMTTQVYAGNRAPRSTGSEEGHQSGQHISLTVTRR